MPKAMMSPVKQLLSDPASGIASTPSAPRIARDSVPGVAPAPPRLPVAELGRTVPSPGLGLMREVFVRVPGAPLGTRVYLESRPSGGPSQRIRAVEMPHEEAARRGREFRALVPVDARPNEASFIPVAVVNGSELRGSELRTDAPSNLGFERFVAPAGGRKIVDDSLAASAVASFPSPKLELLARVQSDLPKTTLFGETPEGLRVSFYITDGNWAGPRIHARYRSEGGDWVLVRRDGVAVPNARATLETSDGGLLYYELTGTIDLGADGYARSLANDWPDLAALSLVARISTASDNWKWLNRLTLVGAGVVNLKLGHTSYDLYSIGLDSEALAERR